MSLRDILSDPVALPNESQAAARAQVAYSDEVADMARYKVGVVCTGKDAVIPSSNMWRVIAPSALEVLVTGETKQFQEAIVTLPAKEAVEDLSKQEPR